MAANQNRTTAPSAALLDVLVSLMVMASINRKWPGIVSPPIISRCDVRHRAFFLTLASSDQCRSESDVANALRNYANCSQSTDSHHDCSSEFSALQSAQDDFESAVTEYEDGCQ